MEKRLIFLGEEVGRHFLVLPQEFRPKWPPSWLQRRLLLRPDVFVFAHPEQQAKRALKRTVYPGVTRKRIRLLKHVANSKGCSSPLMHWYFCLVEWTPEALARVPVKHKIWLVDELGTPAQLDQKLFVEAQVALGLSVPEQSVAA